MKHGLLARHRGIAQPPLIPAMDPAGRRAARWARGLQRLGAGLDADRPAGQEHALNRDSGQVREQDRKDINIAREHDHKPMITPPAATPDQAPHGISARAKFRVPLTLPIHEHGPAVTSSG